MIDPKRTVLWSASSVAPNNTSITLSDSIDNYDELVYYGSAYRTWMVAVKNEYPVRPGVINGGGPFHFGRWGAGDNYLLANGTQMYLSGTSGQIVSSYYWGKTNGNTGFIGALVANRSNDVRPYKIEGLKYTTADDRTLLWSATGNPYDTNITLSESIAGFEKIMVYGSGRENQYGFHVSKQVYNTQSGTIGCEPWGYSPWATNFRCNYLLGSELRISGNSGHIGSAWYMGLNQTSTAWAAGKWTGTNMPKMLMPYEIYGINRK